MKKEKFADVPTKSYFFIQLLLMLPAPFIFCFLAGHSLPSSVGMGLMDIGASLLTLVLFIPVMFASMVMLKIIFYGAIRGTQRRVSLRTKNIVTALFIFLAIPPASMVQAESFLWITNRPGAEDSSQAVLNGAYLFLAGVPGFVLSLKELKQKIALIKEKKKLLKAN